MSTDAAAREYLDYYLDRAGSPDFAVMLEGPWGSGKTFFSDAYFVDRDASARAKDPKAKSAIRVSLFGVRDLADINSEIFAKAHPLLGGKAVKFANVIGSKIGSVFGASLDPKENEKLLQDMLLNLEGRVLVFDDFERSPLDVVEVMGFINRFVEQDKLKAIVLASEDDIDPEQLEEYKSRKEKLIGKTIRVGSDPGTVLDAFAKQLSNLVARDAIAANRDAVLRTFAASGRPNFRSLRAVLADFDRLVSLANPKLSSSANGLSALLLYLIALGVEFRGNGIDADGLRTLQADMAPRLSLGGKNISPERERAATLRARYPLVHWHDPIVLPEVLGELFASGMIDVPSLDDHLGAHPLIVGRAAVPAWRAMWNWYDMGATEYVTVRNELERQLAAREIGEPGEILHAAGTTIRLQGLGDDLLGGQTPKDFFTSYIDDLEKNSGLHAAPQTFGVFGRTGHAGLGYNECDTSAFAEVRALVEAGNRRACSREMQRQSKSLLDRLKDDQNEVGMLHEWGLEDGNYAGTAILHHIPVAEMADLLLVDSKLNDNLIAGLQARYEQTGGSTDLDPEKPWLRALHAEVKKRLVVTPAPYRGWGESRLKYWYDKLKPWATPAKPKSTSKQAAKRPRKPKSKTIG